MTLLANLAVTCYAFPAFLRTKRRAFLAIGFAALTFAAWDQTFPWSWQVMKQEDDSFASTVVLRQCVIL